MSKHRWPDGPWNSKSKKSRGGQRRGPKPGDELFTARMGDTAGRPGAVPPRPETHNPGMPGVTTPGTGMPEGRGGMPSDGVPPRPSGGFDTPPPRTWAPNVVHENTGPAWDRRGKAALIGLTLLASAWAIATVIMGAPILGRTWSWWGLLGLAGTGATVYGLWGFVAKRGRPPFGYVLGCGTLVVVLLGSFMWGVTHSVVIDGKIYGDWSTEAKASRLANELLDDREYFSVVDDLLALDPASARTRFQELEPAQKRMEAISQKWDQTNIEGLPDGDFAPIVEQARAASYFGAQALERKRALLGIQDERLAAELQTFRNTFVTNALKMGPDLKIISEKYGFNLGGTSVSE